MKKENLRFVQMSNYTSPVVKEIRGKDWVEYGEDNNYFQYLIDRYNGSPTNNACINGISQMIYGRGLEVINKGDLNDYAKFLTLIKQDCVQKLINDFYLLGQGALQIIYNIDHTEILEVEHFPVQTLRSGKANEEGEVDFYYYFYDWSQIKRSDKPEPIPAFGTSTNGNEILYIKPYKSGFYYYSPPAYQGGVQYAELEEEISNYHLNNILNGLAPSMLINFNNGIPDEDMQQTIEDDIKRKYQGTTNAGRFILAFNDKADQAATLEAVQLSDAHNQYQFLSDESVRKIMLSHRVVSPMLLGIKDQTGLGNNADELKTASILMDNIVIRPFQDMIIDAIEKVLHFNKMNLELYFKTLQPLEFTNALPGEEVTGTDAVIGALNTMSPLVATKVLDSMTPNEIRSLIQLAPREEGTEIDIAAFTELSSNEDLVNEVMAQLQGEEIGDEWELIASIPAGEEEHYFNNLFKFAAQIQPTGSDSWQDNDLWKIRYSYAGNPSPEREFCKLMLGNNLYYRYEDLDRDLTVNPGFGPRGAADYNIWLYKGGANCKHFWMRNIFLRKDNGKISVNQAIKMINDMDPKDRAKYRLPINDPKVAKIPYDMPNNGYLNPR